MKKVAASLMLSSLCLALLTPGFAFAKEEQVFMKRKPGYWIADIENSAMPGTKVKYKECSNEESDKRLLNQSLGNDSATSCDVSSKKSGSGYLSEMSCSGEAAGQTFKMSATFDAQGDFEKAFTINGSMTMEGLPLPPIKMVMKYKYQGECPAGMEVGDLITEGLPGGPKKINILK